MHFGSLSVSKSFAQLVLQNQCQFAVSMIAVLISVLLSSLTYVVSAFEHVIVGIVTQYAIGKRIFSSSFLITLLPISQQN